MKKTTKKTTQKATRKKPVAVGLSFKNVVDSVYLGQMGNMGNRALFSPYFSEQNNLIPDNSYGDSWFRFQGVQTFFAENRGKIPCFVGVLVQPPLSPNRRLTGFPIVAILSPKVLYSPAGAACRCKTIDHATDRHSTAKTQSAAPTP